MVGGWWWVAPGGDGKRALQGCVHFALPLGSTSNAAKGAAINQRGNHPQHTHPQNALTHTHNIHSTYPPTLTR